MRILPTTLGLLAAGFAAGPAFAQWVTYENETETRLVAASPLGATDPEEKDYAWGDVDQDGDVDLVVVRKQPFSTPGRHRNVLFMNEGIEEGHSVNGVLVDRTVDFMTNADDGGQGFLDLTNDRDVILADVDGDDWLDVVTSTAYGDSLPKTISHARIYMNQGEVGGVWQGFRYEEPRIPQLIEAPDTCGVAAGDVTGNGLPDLYFVTYNSTTLEDHLLINQGGGFYQDESNRMSAAMRQSSFGSATHMADLNGDELVDIIKSENGPVKIMYNGGNGFFNQWETASSGAHYHVSLGELNNDGQLDLVISDDGQDKYRINLGPGGDGMADFGNQSFTYSGGGFDDGFGGNSITADLNNDGFNDVVLTDVDVDAGGLGRRTHIYRNLGNLPNPTLQEQQVAGKVVNIPTSMLTGTHDAAPIDINGDGWLDLVIGRCSGTQIWMNQPPVGVLFTYPNGLPVQLPPDEETTIQVNLDTFGDAQYVAGTAKMFVAVNDGPFTELAMTDLGEDLVQGTFPATACTSTVEFYFSADLEPGGTFTDPPSAPGNTYVAISALGTEVALLDEIEEDVSDWSIIDEGAESTGQWVQAEPFPTVFNGDIASPEEDASSGHEKVKAFVTGYSEDPNPSDADVDGGPVHLLSPVLDLANNDATVSYARWFFSAGGGSHVPDFLEVSISPDGGNTWVPVPEHTTGGTGGEWEVVSFEVSSYIEPTSEVQVHFTTADEPNNSVTEAGIDDFSVEVLDCGDSGGCEGDVNGSGSVDVEDLVALVVAWGTDDENADLNGDGTVNVQDMVALVLNWGDCG